jgi:hypothetical protein
LEIDRVNLAIISIRKVQTNYPDIPKKFRQVIQLIIYAYKQLPFQKCVVCEMTNKSNCEPLEKHHLAGRTHYPDSIPVCVSCHNRLTEKQKKWQNDLNDEKIRLASYFDGIRDLFELLLEFTNEKYLVVLVKEFTNRAWSIRYSSKG